MATRKFIDATATVKPGAKLASPVRLYGQVLLAGEVSVGKYTYIGPRTRVYGPTTIGNYCSIARDVEIAPMNHPLDHLSTHPFQYSDGHFTSHSGYSSVERVKAPDREPTSLGNDVWIGSKVFVRAGIRVGTGAVLAANASVVHDVEPYSVVAGSPARVIKKRFDDDIIARMLRSQWWELEPSQLSSVSFDNVETALDQVVEIKQGLLLACRQRLSGTLVNDFSGSAIGIIWVSFPGGHLLRELPARGSQVEILDVRPGGFKGHPSQLQAGLYTVESLRFDAERQALRIVVASSAGKYGGTVGQGCVTLRFRAPIRSHGSR